MNGYDLDYPLALDECLVCGFVGFECICDTSHPHRRPTAIDLETARAERAVGRQESQK